MTPLSKTPVFYDENDPLPAHYEALREAVLPNRCRTEPRPLDVERAQKSVDRTNKKRIAKFEGTLFAGDAHLIGPLRTAAQLIDLVEDKFASVAAGDRRLFVAGTYYRHLYRGQEGDAKTAFHQERFVRIMPHADCRWADFWWQRLRELDNGFVETIDRDKLPVLGEEALLLCH